jgi:hypothetical protein
LYHPEGNPSIGRALSIPVMFAGVAGFMSPLGEAFISATGIERSANWSVGEIVKTLGHGTFRAEIQRPVFDALIGEHKEGFVQVAWRPADGLPARIRGDRRRR